MKIRQAYRAIAAGFNQLLWPALCANCGENISQTDKVLCGSCWSSLLAAGASDYCPRCGIDVSRYAIVAGACPVCQSKEIFFDGIARGGVYTADVLRRMVLLFKNDKTGLNAILSLLTNSALQGAAFYHHVDFFVPVPLHWIRRLRRGYNQSSLLAEKLKHPTAKVNTDLVRVRYTKSQPAMLTEAGRIKNVAGAFAVRSGHSFAGRNICLVDDIKTTGATLNECAKTLKQAGASKVFAVVLAVAGQNYK